MTQQHLDLFALLPSALAQAAIATLATDELTSSFVGDAGGIAHQNGRAFVCFKPPGQQRNMLYKLIVSPSVRFVPIGLTPAPTTRMAALRSRLGQVARCGS